MNLSRRQFLGGAASALLLGGAPRSKRPNILFILPDQLRAQALGYMGNKDVRSPNIDKLASESVVFENTFANTPVCCPARANILTGTYAHRNGMTANDLRLREERTTIAEILRDAGYRTGFVGKWHLDGGPREPGFVPPGPRRQGFDFWAAHECSHAHFNNHYFRDTDKPIPFGKFEAEGWTDVALGFLDEAGKDERPFFLTVQMGPPHNPYKAPPEYSKLYDPAKLTMRPNWEDGARLPGRKDIAEYYGMITAVDDQVGRMMRKLDELGIREDTIVLFSSDHGDMLGSQGRDLKRKPWEESIRVPGVLRYPSAAPAGRRSDAMFTHVDFAPTLLGLCGVKAPRSMQGIDLSTLVRTGRQPSAPDSAFFQIFGPFEGDGTEDGWRGVRTKQYMYARFESKPWVLYDIQKDPYQMHNLVGDPSAAAIEREMEAKLAGWMKRTGDAWSYNWHHLVEDNGRLYRHQTFYSVDDYMKWAKQHPDLDKAKQH
jgi:arylsulfatase A-like enzyme